MGTRPNANLSEEEYIEECRQKYRKMMDDTEFVVKRRITRIAMKLNLKDKQEETQVKMAISRLMRSHLGIPRINFVGTHNREDAFAFLDGIEKLMGAKAD